MRYRGRRHQDRDASHPVLRVCRCRRRRLSEVLLCPWPPPRGRPRAHFDIGVLAHGRQRGERPTPAPAAGRFPLSRVRRDGSHSDSLPLPPCLPADGCAPRVPASPRDGRDAQPTRGCSAARRHLSRIGSPHARGHAGRRAGNLRLRSRVCAPQGRRVRPSQRLATQPPPASPVGSCRWPGRATNEIPTRPPPFAQATCPTPRTRRIFFSGPRTVPTGCSPAPGCFRR